MAAKWEGIEYVLTGGTVTLTTALGMSQQFFFSHGALRANHANAGEVGIGKSNVTNTTNRLAYLRPGEAFEFALEGTFVGSDQIFIDGTAADILHIALVV